MMSCFTKFAKGNKHLGGSLLQELGHVEDAKPMPLSASYRWSIQACHKTLNARNFVTCSKYLKGGKKNLFTRYLVITYA